MILYDTNVHKFTGGYPTHCWFQSLLIVGFNLSLRNMAKTPTGRLDSQLLAARCCADADRVFGYQLETRS